MPDPKLARSAEPAPFRLRAKDLLVVSLLVAGAVQLRVEGNATSSQPRAPRLQQTAARPAPARLSSTMPAMPLVAQVAPPGYAQGSSERAVFDALNEARAKGNFGLLAQDVRLDSAAAAHASYLALNLPGSVSHWQDANRPGYSGETPIDRVRAAGYDTSVSYEAISSGTTAGGCLELLNTVYHLESLMIGVTDVGIAVNRDAGCVVEPQSPRRSETGMQARPVGTVGVYPYPGQSGVPAAFMPATEIPNPAPDLGDAVAGPPILVDLNSEAGAGLPAPATLLSRFALTEAQTGAPVAARILGGRGMVAAADAVLEIQLDRRLVSAGHVFLLPLQPLKAATAYAVDFRGSANGLEVSRRWGFTTR